MVDFFLYTHGLPISEIINQGKVTRVCNNFINEQSEKYSRKQQNYVNLQKFLLYENQAYF